MEYTLFQDFAHKIPRPVPPTGRPGRAQSGRTPEFGWFQRKLTHFAYSVNWFYLNILLSNSFNMFKLYNNKFEIILNYLFIMSF